MNHLHQEELVLSYYGEADLGADRREHLAQCQTCIAELAALAAVLDRVTPVDVPEPDDDYEARVWSRLQWRLRADNAGRASARPGGLKPALRWLQSAAIAATVIFAFLAGVLWKSSDAVAPVQVATATTTAATPVASGKAGDSTRILFVVVGEHFDQSERILVELTNLTPGGNDTDISSARERAEDLIDSNRLYRRTALDRGEEDVATLLDELEPVLLQIAHAPSHVSAEELRAMQKRVESKGLVFKLRVVRADVHRTAATSTSI